MRLQIQLLHPERIKPSCIREVFARFGCPKELLQGVRRMAIPRFVDEDAAHNGEAGTETIRVSHTEEGEKRRDEC